MNVVLNYGPKHAHDHDRADRVYLVWPSAAWRVVAPLPADRRINILQKAVLGVCRSASYPASEIAARLRLHPRLVEVIGMELIRSGWVDQANWRPTAKGLTMLEEEETAMDSLVSGWVFQNPWTGDLWPFFARQFHVQETSPVADRSRLALLFDTNKGTRKNYAWVPDAPQTPGQPTTEAILEAVRRFRRREKLKGSMRLLDSGFDEPLPEGPPGALSRISFISDQPEPAGLVTYAYVPRGGALDPQICDPFGFGCALPMWRQLLLMAHEDEAASGAMRDLLRLANAKDAPAMEEARNRVRQIAEETLVAHLTLDIKTFPAVFNHLVDATNTLLSILTSPGEPQGELASVLQFCRKALEAILKHVWTLFPVSNVHTMLTGDPAKDLATINVLVSTWGYPLPPPIELQPKPAGGPDKGSVKKASLALGNAYMLPSAVLATVLAASRNQAHPIRQAAARDPQLLNKIASMIRLGNAGSHDDSHAPIPKRFTIPEAKEMHLLSMQVAASLLNVPFTEKTSYE
jgi:hypothetical protein